MKTLPRLRWCLVLLFGTLSAGAATNLDERLNDLFQEWNRPGTPGAAVAVIQHGQVVFEKGYGRASLEYDVPVTPATVFHVASVSKQFTAMALVLLELDGKLSLEDDVHKYLSELPDYGQKITIRHLLQHTSGIRDQWQTLALAGWRLDDVITQQQILRLLFHQRELNFPPGTRHLYSNGGYTLAAEIVARVSGRSFPDFCDERIFRPLGMSHTHFHIDHCRIVPARAYSYGKQGDGYQALPLNYANVGATSLFTTAGDLVRWLDNFREPKVGGREAVARLQTPGVLNSGEKLNYGLGVAVGPYRGLKTVSHGGGDAGYRSYVLWFPEQELGVAVVSGLASFDSGGVANRVAEVFLEDKMSARQTVAKAPARKFITVPNTCLDQYVGHYRMEVGIEANLVRDGDTLYVQVPGQSGAPLQPLATNRFYLAAKEGELEFTPKPSGGCSLKFTHADGTMLGERVGSEPAVAPDLSSYQGVYWSEELETQYTVRLKGAKLIADHVHHGEIELQPTTQDKFASGEWFMPQINFLRDSAGQICGLTLGGGRVTAVRFDRKQNPKAAR